MESIIGLFSKSAAASYAAGSAAYGTTTGTLVASSSSVGTAWGAGYYMAAASPYLAAAANVAIMAGAVGGQAAGAGMEYNAGVTEAQLYARENRFNAAMETEKARQIQEISDEKEKLLKRRQLREKADVDAMYAARGLSIHEGSILDVQEDVDFEFGMELALLNRQTDYDVWVAETQSDLYEMKAELGGDARLQKAQAKLVQRTSSTLLDTADFFKKM